MVVLVMVFFYVDEENFVEFDYCIDEFGLCGF